MQKSLFFPIRLAVVCCFCVFFSVSCMQQGANNSARELAQHVAALRVNTDLVASTRQLGTLAAMHEQLNALRRSVAPGKDLVRDVHPRVLASVDAVLGVADATVSACKPLCLGGRQRSSLSPAEKRTVVAAQLISFKQLLNALFASIDREARLCGDEPRIATQQIKHLVSGSTPLALVEAGEQFAQTVNRMTQPCASCRGCARDLWCAECKEQVQRIQAQDLIERCAHETKERIGVDDAFTYLSSRVGATSRDADVYNPDALSVAREDFERIQSMASARKTMLDWCAKHGLVAEALAHMSDDQLTVETGLSLLENAPVAINLAANAARTANSSYNPLTLFPAQLFCWLFLGGKKMHDINDATKDLPEGQTLGRYASAAQEGVKGMLGISDKELPTLCNLLHLVACPANKLALKGATWIKESSPFIDAFARDYSRPLRDQYVTPECSEALELMAHAWKTGGIARPQTKLSLVGMGIDCSVMTTKEQQNEDDVFLDSLEIQRHLDPLEIQQILVLSYKKS